MEIINLKDIELDSNLINNNPNLFYSERWLKILNSQYPYHFFAIHKDNNFLIASKIDLFGFSKIKSLPFCDYTIPSVENTSILQELIGKLQSFYPNHPIEIKIIFPPELSKKALNYDLKHTAYCHSVDTSSKKRIEANMHSSFLRGMRKAEKNGLDVTISVNKSALVTFYEIYHRLRMYKFGKLPQPYSFFEKIMEHFISNESGFILEIRKESTVVSSAIVLEHENIWYYKFGCSRANYLHLRPNNLLFFELLNYANKKGIHTVDLGLSGTTKSYEGLIRFKEYMGGKATNIYSLRLEPDDYSPAAERKLNNFTSQLTNQIISLDPGQEAVDKISTILYPCFA